MARIVALVAGLLKVENRVEKFLAENGRKRTPSPSNGCERNLTEGLKWKPRNDGAFMEWGARMSEPMSERRLIEACQQGDREAFRQLFEAHKDRVWSVALHFTGDETAARRSEEHTSELQSPDHLVCR